MLSRRYDCNSIVKLQLLSFRKVNVASRQVFFGGGGGISFACLCVAERVDGDILPGWE